LYRSKKRTGKCLPFSFAVVLQTSRHHLFLNQSYLHMKTFFFLVAALCFFLPLFAQTFQTSETVDVLAVDGKVYKATVVAIEGDKYKVSYEGYPSTSAVWLTAPQLQKPAMVGSAVEMYGVDGKWYKATVRVIKGEEYRLHFEGYDATNDRWLKREQFRTVSPVAGNPPPLGKAQTSSTAPTVGSKVEILWGGTWYKGSVVEEKGEQYKVHYDGWDSSWDEWVKKDRLRTPQTQSTATTGSMAGQRPAAIQKPQAAVVKQTYSGTTGKLYLRTFGRVYGGRYSLDINWVFLGADGTIVYDPVSGVDPIDYKTEERHNSNKIGKYKLAGKKMFITWRNGKKEEWGIETKGAELTVLDGGIVTRQARMPAAYRLDGQFAASAVMPNLGSVRTFVFSKDGSFTLNTLGTVTTPDVAAQKEWDQKGTYFITGNTLTLQFASGEKKKSLICIWDMGDGTKSLVINGSYFPQEK
jgi:hypothetical protein